MTDFLKEIECSHFLSLLEEHEILKLEDVTLLDDLKLKKLGNSCWLKPFWMNCHSIVLQNNGADQ